MAPHTVEIEKLSGNSETDLETFNTKLSDALHQKLSPVILCLNPGMPAGMALVEWLENWNLKFHNAGMVFVVVAENTLQAQSIELSHPDDKLHFVTSLDNVAKYLPEESAHSPEVTEKTTDTFTMPAYQKDSSPTESAMQSVQNDFETLAQSPVTPPPTMHCGQIAQLSGEYICMSCSISRMWLKGDTITNCDNPECLKPSEGWQLTWELF